MDFLYSSVYSQEQPFVTNFILKIEDSIAWFNVPMLSDNYVWLYVNFLSIELDYGFLRYIMESISY